MNATFRFAMLIVTVITIIENGSIVALTYGYQEVRHVPQSALIVSMSVADLLIGLIVMPLALYYEFNVTWELGLIVCDFWISADIMCSTASILSIAFISIDKYFSLIHSSRYFGRERLRWVRLFVGITWATATFVAFSAGASGWARAKPLPPRDFHADLDQVIADWPLRVNFTNVSLRQALEYVENLESDAVTPTADDECTITNNPIFALYSGMVSFYLPAAAILYFSCKIRWISALTLARHERVTTQRMKMMKSKAKKRRDSLFAIGGISFSEEDEADSVVEDDDAVYQEYKNICNKVGSTSRRSGIARTLAIAKDRNSRRAGLLLSAEAAFADELFSEESITQPESIDESQPTDNKLPAEVPQNSAATYPSISSVGTSRRTTTQAMNNWKPSMIENQILQPDQLFRRICNIKVNVNVPSTSQAQLPSKNLLPHTNSSKLSSVLSRGASPSNSKRRDFRQRSSGNTISNCDCISDLPSSIRFIDETSFTEHAINDKQLVCPTVSGKVARGSSRLSQKSSIKRQSPANLNVPLPSTYFDDISLRFIDESTATSFAKGDMSADLLPLPSLPTGVIVTHSSHNKPSAVLNVASTPHSVKRHSPFSLSKSKRTTSSEANISDQFRRSTDALSFRQRAMTALSRLKVNYPLLPSNKRNGKNLESSQPGWLRRMSRLSGRLKSIDAGGHLNAIGEYRSYMKALRRKERRTANLWLATVITFLACWAPFFFCYPLSCFVEVPVELMIFLPWLGYANSTINPILHAFVEPVFLKVLAKFVLSILPSHWI